MNVGGGAPRTLLQAGLLAQWSRTIDPGCCAHEHPGPAGRSSLVLHTRAEGCSRGRECTRTANISHSLHMLMKAEVRLNDDRAEEVRARERHLYCSTEVEGSVC